MISVSLKAACARRIWQTSTPVFLGIITSSTTRSGWLRRAFSSASSPSLAVNTSYPSFERLYLRISRISGSSSAISTFRAFVSIRRNLRKPTQEIGVLKLTLLCLHRLNDKLIHAGSCIEPPVYFQLLQLLSQLQSHINQYNSVPLSHLGKG